MEIAFASGASHLCLSPQEIVQATGGICSIRLMLPIVQQLESRGS